jgi:hypothetical protein
MWAVCARLFAAKYAVARHLPSERRGIGLASPVESQQVTMLDRGFLAALAKGGFDVTDDSVDCTR